jgi:hypothetical protein
MVGGITRKQGFPIFKMKLLKPQSLREFCYFVIYRHKNTQEARQVGIIGVERRAPPLVRLSPAKSSLLARLAQHAGLPDAKIERALPADVIERR